MCTVLASAKTFVDKTNLDQLQFRVLDSGQMAWNEEDGSAVLYVGSPSEVKNLRVTDPTALRGFRYKTISDELTLCCTNPRITRVTGGFKWTRSSSADAPYYKYEYKDVSRYGHDVTYVASKGSASVADSGHWESGLYINNGDGTYTATTLADGTLIGGSNYVGNVQYAYQHKYLEFVIDIVSKDVNIEELDFNYSESASGGIGDMDPINVTREIVYNGRSASLILHVNYTSGDGKMFEVKNFSATCMGEGDVVQVNDLLQNQIWIYDSLTDENGRRDTDRDGEYDQIAGAFNLYNLRKWAKNLYNGNRGEHWANYKATNHVDLADKVLYWSVGRNMIGVSGNNMFFNSGDDQWMVYYPGTAADIPVEYQGVTLEFSAIRQNKANEEDPNCWTMDVEINVPAGKSVPGTEMLEMLYCTGLERPCLWYPIVCEWRSLDNGAGLSYRVIMPLAYSEPTKGFWKARINTGNWSNKLKIKAQLQCIGSDGKMYNLSWPTGGGTVTATLAD